MSPRFTTFRLAGHLFGVPVGEVQEAVPTRSITPVPLAPPEVLGLMNLRGRILTAIDLRRRLGLPAGAAGEPTMTMVLTPSRGSFGLIVDALGEVLEADRGRFEKPPETLQGEVRTMIRGAYTLEPELLLELELDSVLAIGTRPGTPRPERFRKTQGTDGGSQ